MSPTSREQQIQLIQESIPGLEISQIEEGRGQFNNVLLINDQYVARFPRTPAGAETLVRETGLLQAVAPWITLAVPEPLDVSGDANFMIYRKLPGEPLTPDRFHRLDTGTQEAIVDQMTTFLKESHSIPLDEVPGSQEPDERADAWIEFYNNVRQELHPHMRADAQREVDDHFQPLMENPEMIEFEPVFRHGDLGPGNILIDPQTWSLSGIIDFGSAGPGDPAQDIGGLWTSYGDSLIERLIVRYPEIGSMLNRARFYIGTYALQQALSGLRDGDDDTFNDGIAAYR